MSQKWQWLTGRKLSLGKVESVSDETATVVRGNDRFCISVEELLEEDYRSQDKVQNEMDWALNTAGYYKP